MTTDTIDDLARRVHRWIAIEALLFETLGQWTRELPEPAVKRTMATWCHRHAWHADLWRSRLPAIPHHEVAPDDATWLAPLRSAMGNVSTTAEALAVLSGPVLEALEDAAAQHRDAIDVRLDGPTARVLDLVDADLVGERAALREL